MTAIAMKKGRMMAVGALSCLGFLSCLVFQSNRAMSVQRLPCWWVGGVRARSIY